MDETDIQNEEKINITANLLGREEFDWKNADYYDRNRLVDLKNRAENGEILSAEELKEMFELAKKHDEVLKGKLIQGKIYTLKEVSELNHIRDEHREKIEGVLSPGKQYSQGELETLMRHNKVYLTELNLREEKDSAIIAQILLEKLSREKFEKKGLNNGEDEKTMRQVIIDFFLH